MKRFASCVLLCLAFSAPLFAATYPVSVQCSIEGPAYPGALEVDVDLASWKVTRCNKESDYWSRATISGPGTRLSFNGIEYVSSESVTEIYTKGAECKGDRRYEDVHFLEALLKNRANGFEVGGRLYFIPGNEPLKDRARKMDLRGEHSGWYCTVLVQPQK